jgi:flagellar basal body-associated protein FliL
MTTDPSNTRPSSEEGTFSLEDLDKIIDEIDPKFKDEMNQIKAVSTAADVVIETIDTDNEDSANKAATSDATKVSFLTKFRNFMFSPFLKLKLYLKLKILNLKTWFSSFKIKAKQFLTYGLPELLKYLLSRTIAILKVTIASIKNVLNKFIKLSSVEKLAFFFTIAGIVGSLFFLTKTFTGAWLPRFEDPMLHSLEDGSKSTGSYRNQEDMQYLLQAFPEVEFYVLLNKVVVNLQPDATSSLKPMGIFELYLGLDSQDTAIEARDRELEMVDIIQRSLESFTYSEFNTPDGIVRIKSYMREQLNSILNQGKVLHVFFKTMVIKN